MIKRIALVALVGMCAKSATAGINDRCQMETFSDFYSRFITDPVFAEGRTIWPLPVRDRSAENSSKMQALLGEERNAYLKNYWNSDSSFLDFLKANPNIRGNPDQRSVPLGIVAFRIGGVKTLFDLRFETINGCWNLVKVVNYTNSAPEAPEARSCGVREFKVDERRAVAAAKRDLDEWLPKVHPDKPKVSDYDLEHPTVCTVYRADCDGNKKWKVAVVGFPAVKGDGLKLGNAYISLQIVHEKPATFKVIGGGWNSGPPEDYIESSAVRIEICD